MHTLRRVFPALLLLSLAPLGCGEPGGEAREQVFRGDPVPCPKCQFNAAQVNGSAISALDLTGAPNEQGVAVLQILDPEGHPYTLGVHVDREEELAAYDDGVLVAHGEDLVGWVILVDVEGSFQRVVISAREEEPSWASDAETIALYALDVLDDQGGHNVCPGHKPGVPAVTLLHGETYDQEFKEVDFVGEQWLTLACRDEAMYKVKRMGYGPNGNQGYDRQPATVAQRTAALKMVTADYCGTGHSFTESHTQVLWNNRAMTVKIDSLLQYVAVEAFWDEHGARCLDKPRLVDKAAVLAECAIPACSTFSSNSAWEWRTYAPMPLPNGQPPGPNGRGPVWKFLPPNP
ncbi:ADYC domain-containing protein [Nannocystis pusilla]|uniref:ADYC domain-containing protein n=1 Tax=Nannocystis pusilla TaxID=889268 RepID=UPI003DA6873C